MLLRCRRLRPCGGEAAAARTIVSIMFTLLVAPGAAREGGAFLLLGSQRSRRECQVPGTEKRASRRSGGTSERTPKRRGMALVPVGSAHAVAGIIHVQILRDDTISDPQKAFSAQIDAPEVPQQTLPLANGSSLQFPLSSGKISGTIRAEVDDFTALPAGATAQDVTGISCKVVFKLIEFFTITIGSVPVTASLK
jgi:hypothetical protein